MPDPLHCGGRPLPRDVKRAVDHMRRNRDRGITIADLARVSGAAARTLTRHFTQFLGMPPMSYLRRLRLAATREMLLRDTESLSITEVASQNGFAHFGRFAAQYRRAFGETPSATLQRGRAPQAWQDSDVRSCGTDPGPTRPKLFSREAPSIVVLPCQTSLTEYERRWFADALADEITVALGATRALSVLMLPRARRPMGDPRRAAHELGGRYFLTGQLTGADRRLRLIFRLVETATGQHVWGDSYDGTSDDLRGLQDRLIAELARAILPNIRNAEIGRAQRARPRDLDAYGLTMRALPLVFASQPDATRRAQALLLRAMEIDPDYGLATGLAAWCHGQLVMYNGASAPAAERASAIRLAERAAILDDGDPLVLTARCAVLTMAGAFDAADAVLARALQRDPNSAWAWGRSGWLNAYLGNTEAAIAHLRRAVAIEPSSPSNANNFVGIASAHFGAGRYHAAAAWTRRALGEQPGAQWANRTLSVSYARLGERLKALESLDALRRYSPDLTVGRVLDAVPFRQYHLDRLAEGLEGLGLPA